MPCYETRETTVQLHAPDLDALAKGLEAEGHKVTSRTTKGLRGYDQRGYPFSFEQGTGFTADTRSPLARDVDATKRAYAREVVKAQAKKAGWQARFQGDAFTLTKRRF